MVYSVDESWQVLKVQSSTDIIGLQSRSREEERERERERGGDGGVELELGVLAITANLVRFDRNLSKIGQKIASFRVMGTPESR